MPWGLYLAAFLFAIFMHLVVMTKSDTYMATYTVLENGYVRNIATILINSEKGKPNYSFIQNRVGGIHKTKPMNIKVVALRRVNRAWRFGL